MPAVNDSFRLDFKVSVLETDEETGMMKMGFVPDPERYEEIELNGERAYRDRFEGFIIPERVIAEAAPTLSGLPITFAPPLIKDALAYIETRREPIARRLAGASPPAALADPSSSYLADLAGTDHEFAIISVDLVGSTTLAATLERQRYLALIDVLAAEIAEIAPLFHGHVLKFTGDGALLYIPGPSSNQQNDLAIDCALTIRALIYRVLNPELLEIGQEGIEVRIGIDAGAAAVHVLGSPASKSGADIIGEVVNLACKVESTGSPGDIRVGGIAARSMHHHWRQQLEPILLAPDWPYTDEYGAPYPLYRVKGSV